MGSYPYDSISRPTEENRAQLQHRVSLRILRDLRWPLCLKRVTSHIPLSGGLSHLVFLVSGNFAKGLLIRLCLPRLCTQQACPGAMEAKTRSLDRFTESLCLSAKLFQGTHYSWQNLPLFSFTVLHLLCVH